MIKPIQGHASGEATVQTPVWVAHEEDVSQKPTLFAGALHSLK